MAMAKAMLAVVVAVAALAAQLAAAAVDHPVGGSGAWDASGGTSYSAWSAKQKFVQGDTLSFKYASSHDVTEVTKAGYDACSGANPVKSYTGGATKVTLTAPGKRYFICSVPGHCAAGMKLEVTVAAAAAAVTAPAPAPTPKPAVTATPAPAPAKSKPRHHRSVAPNPAPAPTPAKSKPRHHKRSVAPNPAPAAATPAAAPSTDDEIPTVSPSTEVPTPKSSGATCIRMLQAKAGMVLAVVMALVLAV